MNEQINNVITDCAQKKNKYVVIEIMAGEVTFRKGDEGRSPRKERISRDPEDKEPGVLYRAKDVSSRGNRKRKDSEVGKSLLCSAKASVGGRYEMKDEEEEDGDGGLSGDQSLGSL